MCGLPFSPYGKIGHEQDISANINSSYKIKTNKSKVPNHKPQWIITRYIGTIKSYLKRFNTIDVSTYKCRLAE